MALILCTSESCTFCGRSFDEPVRSPVPRRPYSPRPQAYTSPRVLRASECLRAQASAGMGEGSPMHMLLQACCLQHAIFGHCILWRTSVFLGDLHLSYEPLLLREWKLCRLSYSPASCGNICDGHIIQVHNATWVDVVAGVAISQLTKVICAPGVDLQQCAHAPSSRCSCMQASVGLCHCVPPCQNQHQARTHQTNAQQHRISSIEPLL